VKGTPSEVREKQKSSWKKKKREALDEAEAEEPGSRGKEKETPEFSAGQREKRRPRLGIKRVRGSVGKAQSETASHRSHSKGKRRTLNDFKTKKKEKEAKLLNHWNPKEKRSGRATKKEGRGKATKKEKREGRSGIRPKNILE